MAYRDPATGTFYKVGPLGYALYKKDLPSGKLSGGWKQSATIRNSKLKDFEIMQMQAIGEHIPSCTFIGFDLETTCLEPSEGIILEYAVVALDKNLKEIKRIEGVIPIPNIPEGVNDHVKKMHCENGLWNDCINTFNSGAMGQNPEQRICQFIDGLALDHETKPVILGSSIGFDIKWMNHHWPSIMPKLHYRQVDVTSPYLLCKGNKVDESEYHWPHGQKHRAMWDIQRSIFLATKYQEILTCGS